MTLREITDWIIYTGSERGIEDSLAFVDSCPIMYHELTSEEHIVVKDLAQSLQETHKREGVDDFFIGGKDASGNDRYKHGMFRCHFSKTIIGEAYELRKIKDVFSDPRDLGLPAPILKASLSRKLATQGGLLVWVGGHANGKTTSCSAVLRERLKRHGGFALTIENPPEVPLHGKVGAHGYCMQTGVEKDAFSDALAGAMRCFPVAKQTILFLGEVRDPETAYMMLNYAGAGYLVMTTVHGGTIEDGLQRIASLADTYQGGNSSNSRILLSQCLRLAVHQRLRNSKITEAHALTQNAQVRHSIENGDWHKLKINIDRVDALINNGKDII